MLKQLVKTSLAACGIDVRLAQRPTRVTRRGLEVPHNLAGLLKCLPPPADNLLRGMAALSTNPDFAKVMQAVSAWPEHSTIGNAEKAVLLWLAGSSKAALEIGTYWAGTTYLLAWALPLVHTIDPYGAGRAPGLLRAWPLELAERVTFHAKNSSEYLWGQELPEFDLMFIDGSHTYANCFHDIAASVVAAAEQAYIVVDNTEQPDVLRAVRDYVTLNPHVEAAVVRDGAAGVQVAGVFDLEDTNFAVLRIDKSILPSGKAVSYHVFGLDSMRLGELRLEHEPADGTAKFQIHLRALPLKPNIDPSMFDLSERREFSLSKEIRFSCGLELPESAVQHDRFCEISLQLESSSPLRAPLFLQGRRLKVGRNDLRG